MKKRNMVLNKKAYTLILWITLLSSNYCFADDCILMKSEASYLTKSSPNFIPSIEKIEAKALSGDFCAKNIIGRFFYEGIIVQQDRDRAKAIFGELTNAGYVPASFNFAFILSEEENPNLELVSSLLIGIYSQNITNKENSTIAIKARDFGYDYFSNLTTENGKKYKQYFEESIKFSNLDGGATIRRQQAEMKQKEEGIVSILMIGMAIKSASNLARASQAARSSPQFIPTVPITPTSYFAYPMGGNMLYLMPRF